MSHEYEYRVWGTDADEMERNARNEAVRYFGKRLDGLQIEASALQNVSGKVVIIEGHCRAWDRTPL